MGLFDNLFMAADLVKGGIAAVKAVDKMEELAEKLYDDYWDVQTSETKRLYKQYKSAKKKYDDNEDLDKQTELSDAAESAVASCILSATTNASLPKSFREEIKSAIAEWQRTNDLAMEIVEKRLMKVAKTDEEREIVRQIIDEAMAEEEEE